MNAAYANDDHIRDLLIGIVPTYMPAKNDGGSPTITVYNTNTETEKDEIHAAG